MSKTFDSMIRAVEAFHRKHRLKGTRYEDLRYRMCLHMEELGELSAAVSHGLGQEAITEELADNLILTLGHAVSAGIRLEDGFWRKLGRIQVPSSRRASERFRMSESGATPYVPPEVLRLRRGIRLEKKKTLEAFQANVRIFQLTEHIRAAMEGMVKLASARSAGELVESAVRILRAPEGLDSPSASVFLFRDGRLVRAASSPRRRKGPVPKGVERRLVASARSRKGGTLVLPLQGDGEVLGFLEIGLWKEEMRGWRENVLRVFSAYLGRMAEHLEREATDREPVRVELEDLQARFKRLEIDLAQPSLPKGARRQLLDLRSEVAAQIRELQKRLEMIRP